MAREVSPWSAWATNSAWYKTLRAKGPMTVEEFAAAADVNQRYLREWASHQAASKYLTYDLTTRKFSLSEEQAMVFAIDDSPFNMIGAFDSDSRLDRQSGEGRTGLQAWRRRELGRPEHLSVLRHRAFLPSRL